MDLTAFLSGLEGAKPSNGENWTARCPAHDDRANSLSIFRGKDGKMHLHCHAGCDFAAILAARGVEAKEWGEIARKGAPLSQKQIVKRNSRIWPIVPKETGPRGITLAEYAFAKQIPEEELNDWGVSESRYHGYAALQIRYWGLNENDDPIAIRWRIALKGDRFRWADNTTTALYGLWRLPEYPQMSFVAIVEGESDCHTLWYNAIPAVGVPGASIWRDDENAEALKDFLCVAVVEPDKGGETLLNLLRRSKMANRIYLADMSQYNAKDASELYLQNPASFKERWRNIVLQAIQKGALKK